LICNGEKGKMTTDSVAKFVQDVIDKLNIDRDDLPKHGILLNYSPDYTDDTNKLAGISYLRNIIFNLGKLKTRARKAADRAANAEADRRMMESIAASKVRYEEMKAARYEEISRDREYERIVKAERNAAARATRNAKLAAHGKIPVAEGDLLGIDSAAAKSGDFINMEALRKQEIKDDLESLFKGGRRTRKHKHRKNRKSRKHSRK
jgi:hypothetical protein